MFAHSSQRISQRIGLFICKYSPVNFNYSGFIVIHYSKQFLYLILCDYYYSYIHICIELFRENWIIHQTCCIISTNNDWSFYNYSYQYPNYIDIFRVIKSFLRCSLLLDLWKTTYIWNKIILHKIKYHFS